MIITDSSSGWYNLSEKVIMAQRRQMVQTRLPHAYHFQILFAFIYVSSLQSGLPLPFCYPGKIPSPNMTEKYLNSPLVTIPQCTCPRMRLCGLCTWLWVLHLTWENHLCHGAFHKGTTWNCTENRHCSALSSEPPKWFLLSVFWGQQLSIWLTEETQPWV